jgi:hypothetical protein
MALMKLRVDDTEWAHKHADIVTKIDPENPKGYYRRA